VDEFGSVKYSELVPIVANTAKAIVDVQRFKARFYAIQRLAETPMLSAMYSVHPEQFQKMLHEAFERVDVQQAGELTGAVPRVQEPQLFIVHVQRV
jgi:hypothetical protein